MAWGVAGCWSQERHTLGKTTERKEPGTRGEPHISGHGIWASAQVLGGPRAPTHGLNCSRLQFTAWRGTGQGSAPLAQIFICISLLTYPVRANYLNLN